MGLMDREYMGESYDDKMKERKRKNSVSKNREEIFRLSNKKHITIFDKMRISKLMKENKQLMEE